MASGLRVGLVEDNPGDARLVREMLRATPGEQVDVIWWSRLSDVLPQLSTGSVGVILLDLGLPDSQGLDTFRHVHREAPRTPIIILSGGVDEELAVSAVATGAQDYLVKGQFDSFLLKRAIRYAIERQRAESEIQELNNALEHRVAERTAQLEEANRELESFSYSVSHDLRAPLRHVQGFVELLQEATAGQLSEQAQRYMKTIANKSVEMGQLIDDLLAFSRMARTEMTHSTVELGQLVDDSIRDLEVCTPGRNIEWQVSPLPAVLGDQAMLKQVFANLIGNAVKYSRLRDPARIDIGSDGESDGQVVVFVRDNGAGFDMQYADRLFGVFQRLHRAEQFEGTGIGLATVRRIVVRHGGRVWAQSEPDRGATFYVTLTPSLVS